MFFKAVHNRGGRSKNPGAWSSSKSRPTAAQISYGAERVPVQQLNDMLSTSTDAQISYAGACDVIRGGRQTD